MIHSTWGDWFISEAVEGSTPNGVSLWYLGCNGFVLRDASTTLYIDPYFGDGDPPGLVRMIPVPMDATDATLCDGVLVTHEHLDHMHPPSYGPLVENGSADVYAPEASLQEAHFDGDLRLPPTGGQRIEPGDSFTIGAFEIHVRGAHDPDAVEPVSYVIEHDAGTFFHGGDTKHGAPLETIGTEFDIDLGALAFGSSGNVDLAAGRTHVTWYMDENEIVDAARALRLDRLVPTHWDIWRGLRADPSSLFEHASGHEYPSRLEIVTIGDRLDL